MFDFINENIAGIDDTTKCPCIGSIFIAGVVASNDVIDNWKNLGVKDSKLIAAKKREELAKIIKETAQAIVLMEITPAMIDDKSLNLNAWEMLVVLTIIKKLQRKATFKKVFIDNWEVSEKLFVKRMEELIGSSNKELILQKGFHLKKDNFKSVELIPEHFADENYTVVGAASILAKVASDAQYRKYKRKYGDFGSGSPGDPQTRLFVWQHRNNPLPIIRTSWNTFKVLSVLDNIEDDEIYGRVKNKRKQSS